MWNNECKLHISAPPLTLLAHYRKSHPFPLSFQVQSKPEKKPGTPPPAPAPASASPAPVPRSPSPPPAPVICTPPPPAVDIPRFYYPCGLPAVGPVANHDGAIEAAFKEFEEEKADIYEMGKIAKVGDKALNAAVSAAGQQMQTVLDASQGSLKPGLCSSSGMWLSALLEGPHVLLSGRREDGICLRSLFRCDLEEVSQTAVRLSYARLIVRV